MAEKTILDSKLVDLTGLGTFWGKVKEQIGNTETSANNYTDEKLGSFTQYDGDGNPIDGTPSGVRAEIENRDAAVLVAAQGYANTAISNLSIDSYLKKTDEKVKDVDTTADKGINLALGTDGKLDVTVTPGSISKNNESVVTGGAVYTAIDNLKIDDYLKSADQVVKSVDETTFYGINLGYDNNSGVLNINVDAGNVVDDDERFVTGDTVHTAIGTAIDNLKIDDYLKSADQVVKDVDTTADKGINLSLGTDGKLNVEVNPGVVGDGEEAVVTGDDVWSAIEAAKTDLSDNLSVTMTSSGDNTSGVKTYNFKQGGKDIGTINIPKDLVVSKGEVKICEKTDDPNYGKKCLELTLSSGDIVHIPVGELADVYTGDETYVTVSDSNVISLNSNFVDGLAKAGDSYLKTDTYNKKEVDDKFTNLPSYEAGAQVNKIEIVKVNDTPLTIAGDKSVNINLTPYLKSADQVVKSVDTTADKGVNISLGTDGKLDVTVDSGVVSSTETKLVTGSAVYTAIDNLKIDDYLKKDGITIATDDDILGIFED
jgi:hypothetical protein